MDAKISISIDFLQAFSRIALSEQKRVREFIEKFQENPLSKAINYEQIYDFKDKNLRTARISSSYRAIVLHPEKGNNFILLWVDHHDEAMKWARNKKIDINKYTGAIQVIDYDIIEKFNDEKSQKVEYRNNLLFHKYKDEELLILGVTEVLLETIKKIDCEKKLDDLSQYLPQEVSEALYYLLCGLSIDETIYEITSKPINKNIDKYDFDKALENDNSQRRFRVVEDAKEIEIILDAPLEQWRVFLHPTQKKLVELNTNGSIRILGGAGTGKTVVALHRAKFLAEKIFTNPKDKILFITYSKNLAIDIRNNISKICNAELISRIEVTNIDQWVNAFMKKQGCNYQILYNGEESNSYWQAAIASVKHGLDISDSFYIDEWNNIIQPNGINDLAEYIKVSRVGSGRSISRETRQKIWPIFKEYRRILTSNNKKEFADIIREASICLKNTCLNLPYKSIIVDEGQDMGIDAYKLIRNIVKPAPNDIFIAADCHQKIYAKKVVLSRCGINVKGQRSKKLKLNYRTTEEIKKWAINILKNNKIDDLDGEVDIQNGYRSLLHGKMPIVKNFESEIKEIDFIVSYIKNAIEFKTNLESICLVARTNDLANKYNLELKKQGLNTYFISRDGIDNHNDKRIRIATMHRVKGLEFNNIIVASANKNVIPLKKAISGHDNETALEEAILREKSLLYVAVTRAKKEVLITSYGPQSDFLFNINEPDK